jgi:hypothetical protein
MATLMTGLDWVRRRKPDTGTTLIDSRGQGSTLNTCAEHAPVHLARLMFHQGPQGDEEGDRNSVEAFRTTTNPSPHVSDSRRSGDSPCLVL